MFPSNFHSSFYSFTQHILRSILLSFTEWGLMDYKIIFPLIVSLMKFVRNEQPLCFKEEVLFEPGFEWWKGDFRQKIENKLLLRAKRTMWTQEQRCQKENVEKSNMASWKQVASTVDESRELQMLWPNCGELWILFSRYGESEYIYRQWGAVPRFL